MVACWPSGTKFLTPPSPQAATVAPFKLNISNRRYPNVWAAIGFLAPQFLMLHTIVYCRF
jgi:hypothetical protein